MSPVTGIDAAKRRAVIFGRGRTPASYIAVDDVAEACVALTLADDPPGEVELSNGEQLTRREVVDAFERAYGTGSDGSRCHARCGDGAHLMRRVNPAMASVLGMALNMDVNGLQADAEPLRRLGTTSADDGRSPRCRSNAPPRVASARGHVCPHQRRRAVSRRELRDRDHGPGVRGSSGSSPARPMARACPRRLQQKACWEVGRRVSRRSAAGAAR